MVCFSRRFVVQFDKYKKNITLCSICQTQINSEDDHGVLMGRWGGSYAGGFRPSHWNGSHAILKSWFNIDCHPVKFGQCWVFAGVMCSGDVGKTVGKYHYTIQYLDK